MVLAAPTNLIARSGDARVTLFWNVPALNAGITHHEYRFKTDADYPQIWTSIPNSAPGQPNQASRTISNLTNGTTYTFQVRAVNDDGPSGPSDEVSVLVGEGLGICSRTPQVRDALLTRIGASNCASVTSNQLKELTGSLEINRKNITTLTSFDFASLSSLDLNLFLNHNQLSNLPEDVFSDLESLKFLRLQRNELSSLPAGVFSGMSSLERVTLIHNPGAPFTLTLMLERTDNTDLTAPGPATIKVKVAEGAPFDMTVSLTATGGTLTTGNGSAITEVTIPKGSIESEAITVTQTGRAQVTISLGTAPSLPADYDGLQTAVGSPLTLF